MNTQKQIDHYRCIVAHPFYSVGDIKPIGYGFNPSDYPHLWEPVYKKEPLCFLPDEHGNMQAMYEGDEYWYCWKDGDGVKQGNVYEPLKEKESTHFYRFATKAAAEAKALELNKVERDSEKVYTRSEMEAARTLLARSLSSCYDITEEIVFYLKQPIK